MLTVLLLAAQHLRVTLGEGACPSDGLAETSTDRDGTYSFRDLSSETYCVSIDPLLPLNLTLLSAGSWTTGNEQTITLTSGESELNADFGWDYQFSP